MGEDFQRSHDHSGSHWSVGSPQLDSGVESFQLSCGSRSKKETAARPNRSHSRSGHLLIWGKNPIRNRRLASAHVVSSDRRARISRLDLSHLCQIRLNFALQGDHNGRPAQASLASELALRSHPCVALSSTRLIAILCIYFMLVYRNYNCRQFWKVIVVRSKL